MTLPLVTVVMPTYNHAPYVRAAIDSVLAQLRTTVRAPIYTGLPFGHVPDKLTLPVGGRCDLDVAHGRAHLVLSDYRQ